MRRNEKNPFLRYGPALALVAMGLSLMIVGAFVPAGELAREVVISGELVLAVGVLGVLVS